MYLGWLEIKKFFFFENFPSSFSLGVMWNLGYIIFFSFIIQVVTGIFIVLFFKVGIESCLKSKLFILKELSFGWVSSYIHLELCNFIFFFLFFHMLKSFYNSVFIHSWGWSSGFFILSIFIFISFTGYSLVGGSLGFWAIVVFMGIIEFLFGEVVSFFIFSDFGALSDLILYKVFCYHFLSSLGVIVFIFLHFYTIHIQGSSIGVFTEFIDFFKFFISSFLKDQLVDFLVTLFFVNFLGFDIENFFSIENFLELDFFKVPEEINSEWYLRLFFILLRSVDSKGVGIFFIFFVLFIIWFKVYSRGLFGEKFFSRFFVFLILIFVWLLILFTLSKYGGSFFLTSFMLFSFVFFFDIFFFYFLDKSFFLFDFKETLCF